METSKAYVVLVKFTDTKGYKRKYFNTNDKFQIQTYLNSVIKKPFTFEIKSNALTVVNL